MSARIRIRAATESDTGQVLGFIRQLAKYERLGDRVTATEEDLRKFLFGARPYAESLIAELDGQPATDQPGGGVGPRPERAEPGRQVVRQPVPALAVQLPDACHVRRCDVHQ